MGGSQYLPVGREDQIRTGSKSGAANRASTAPAPARTAAPAQATVNDSCSAATPNARGPRPLPIARPRRPSPAPAPGADGLARTRVRNKRPVHPHPPANAPTAPTTSSGSDPAAARAIDTAPTAIITQIVCSWGPPSRSARMPVVTRVTMPATLPAASSNPAAPSAMPIATALSVRNTPIPLDAVEAQAAEAATIPSVRRDTDVADASVVGGAARRWPSTRRQPTA